MRWDFINTHVLQLTYYINIYYIVFLILPCVFFFFFCVVASLLKGDVKEEKGKNHHLFVIPSIEQAHARHILHGR